MSKELEKEKGLFSEILEIPLKAEILNRALSNFLKDNYIFSDFELNFNLPLELSKEIFNALITQLSEYFDNFGFTEFAGRIFMVMARPTPENKKRVIIIYEIVNINGKKIYKIENINGKTYLNS